MGTAAYIAGLPPLVYKTDDKPMNYGTFENRRLARHIDKSGIATYFVEDSFGNYLFTIPLKDCIIDSRFREGKLRFRDNISGEEGYIDSTGFLNLVPKRDDDIISASAGQSPVLGSETTRDIVTSSAISLKDSQIENLQPDNPFRKEAAKIISGALEESDSLNRRMILNYCEHFRSAYDTKDIDFLRQVFSNDALIIVGNVVKTGVNTSGLGDSNEKVVYNIHSKSSYLEKLSKIFESNKSIKVEFSDFKILRHPTVENIYGVSLSQKYSSNKYSDEGYIFLLWDFRNRSMPQIHVRTWQPSQALRHGEDPIEISDFNLN